MKLALRTIVSIQTLDELLADKILFNEQVQSLVVEKAAAYGISLKSVGARHHTTGGDESHCDPSSRGTKASKANHLKR